jgi:hypothetical protein
MTFDPGYPSVMKILETGSRGCRSAYSQGQRYSVGTWLYTARNTIEYRTFLRAKDGLRVRLKT